MESSSKKVIYAALTGNALIAITKFVAAGLTGSAAMLSEGIHSCVDTGNQMLLLHGIRQSKKPASAKYPFGHGKEIYFWSFVVALLIFAVGAGVSIYQGIHHIQHPNPIENPMINYVVLGLALIFEGAAWYFALRAFAKAKGKLGYFEAVKKGKDPTLFLVLFEDSAALLGLVVAFLGIYFSQMLNLPMLDGVASIIIGLILATTAIWLAYETKGLLIGESADSTIVEGIRALAAEVKTIDHVNEVLTLHMGPNFILVNLSVDFRNSVPAKSVESAISRLDQSIKENYHDVKRIFIEAEARRTN